MKNFLTVVEGYQGKFGNFYSHLSLETVFPALKLTLISYLNMKISFLENWKFNRRFASLLLNAYQA